MPGDDPPGFELGFDDGDVKLLADTELAQAFNGKTPKALDATEGGVVASESGHPAAADLGHLQGQVEAQGRGAAGRCVVGKTEGRLAFDMSLHVAFYVCPRVGPRLVG